MNISKRGQFLALVTAGCLLFSCLAKANSIYTWVDDKGVTHFSSSPPPPPGARTLDSLPRKRPGNDRWDGNSSTQSPSPGKNSGDREDNGSSTSNSNSSYKPAPYIPPPPPRISDEAKENCRKYYTDLTFALDDAKDLCRNEDLALPLMKDNFKLCQGEIGSVTSNRLNELMCYSLVKEIDLPMSNEFKSCLKETFRAMSYTYVMYEVLDSHAPSSRLRHIIRECKEKPPVKKATEVTLINSYHLHTKARLKKMTSDQLGGLSGIWFSQQNQKFHLVSDSSRLAYMVDMTWTPEDNGSFPKIGTEIEIKNPDSKGAFERFDLEDIVQLQNGHFLVASEVDDGDRNEKESKGKSFFDRMFQTRKSEKLSVTPLMELNAKGELLREIPLPDDLIPKVEEFVKQYECYKPPVYSQSSNTKYSPPPTTKPGSSNIGGSTTTNPRSAGNELLDFYDTAKREASAKAMVAELPPSTTTTTLPPKPQICTSKELRQTRGFSENKGIEALSYLESTKEIFFGTEGPIVQDRSDSQKFVRIYRQLLGQENAAQKYVKYPLTRQFDNSMSALLPLDQNRLLVLERGFDDQKMETHVKIFLVNWASLDKEGYLNKTLIVEMNSLRDQLPAGFRKFDNLEGMTISGETVTDLTLVLISDNNFRDSQVSQIVALKIPKRLLGE